GVAFADLQQSAYSQYSDTHPFRTEPRAALLELKADVWPKTISPNHNLLYPSESLNRTGKLSPLTAKWLEGSGFQIKQTTYTNSYDQKTYTYISAYLERFHHDKYLIQRPLMHTNVNSTVQASMK
ncbi:MAG TPA: hypothetical protein VGH19_00015, partial [Verrucomicrobiae bacterium]